MKGESRFAGLLGLALLLAANSAESQEKTAGELVYEVIPVDANVVWGSLRGYFGKFPTPAEPDDPFGESSLLAPPDPFADLGGWRDVNYRPVTLILPGLSDGEWFDLRPALVDANPDWKLPKKARFLVNQGQRLLYAAAPAGIVEELRGFPEALRRDYPRFWRVSCAVLRMKPETFAKIGAAHVNLDLLQRDDVEHVVSLFPVGRFKESCELSVSSGQIAAKATCGLTKEPDDSLKLNLRFELETGGEALTGELSGPVASGVARHRILANSADATLVLIAVPEDLIVEAFLPTAAEEELAAEQERWRKVGPSVKFVPTEDVPSPEPDRMSEEMESLVFNVSYGFLRTYESQNYIPPDDPFVDLGVAPELSPPAKDPPRFKMPRFEDELGPGPFADARTNLEDMGIKFPPGSCAFLDTKKWRLYVRNNRFNLEMLDIYFESGCYCPPQNIRQRYSFVQSPEPLSLRPTSLRPIHSIGVISRSGERSGVRAGLPQNGQRFWLEAHPVICADGFLLDFRLSIEGEFRDDRGVPVRFANRSAHIFCDGLVHHLPLCGVAGRHWGVQVFAKLTDAGVHEHLGKQRSFPGLDELMVKIAEFLKAEGHTL